MAAIDYQFVPGRPIPMRDALRLIVAHFVRIGAIVERKHSPPSH